MSFRNIDPYAEYSAKKVFRSFPLPKNRNNHQSVRNADLEGDQVSSSRLEDNESERTTEAVASKAIEVVQHSSMDLPKVEAGTIAARVHAMGELSNVEQKGGVAELL
ncbi:unnamed protein product [Peronospora belbahrii]|uniref:Uncharacterized protein n=1 Tax=Peronospora belbahrii TaxID=622444 RepID=A0ABN8CMY4_9STRA|nr:unnamed protein product [Peronospora belbahrii]